jgi:hypothetical protein
VNGDYNTKCVKPDQDIVIPALTKLTLSLWTTFSSLDSINPSRSRPHLAFFAGGMRGFGAIVRTKLGCPLTGSDKILYQKFAKGESYLGTLNQSKFCLLPRGIPAWYVPLSLLFFSFARGEKLMEEWEESNRTERTFEAIYAGCIPVFLADRNLFPYQDILDYSLFSLTIAENEAHRVEEILSSYNDEEISRMQINGLRIRDAFVYDVGVKGDGVNTREWERKGPLFFALVGMKMRLGLQYGGCSSVIKK